MITTEIELYNKYPKIFPLMEDSNVAISSNIPKGWLLLVDHLCGAIQAYTDNINEHNNHLKPVTQVIVSQIKDKFGGLRFYFSGGDKQIEGMVDFAKYLSFITCMDCGKPGGEVMQGNWVHTLCNTCRDEMFEEMNINKEDLNK